MASSDSHENDDDDDDDEDDSDPTAQRERIRRNHVWAIISLLEEQAKGPYHLMVSVLPTENDWEALAVLANIKTTLSGGVTHNLLTRYWICLRERCTEREFQ